MNKRAVLAVWLALLTLTSVVDIAAGASRLDTTALTSAGRYIVALADERANPAGATAAAGVSGRSMAAEAAEVDGRVGRITSDLGVRPSLVFRYSVHGFAATLTQGQLRALARDRRVARIQLDQRVRVDRPVERLKDARSPTDSKSSTSDLASVNVVTLGSPVTPTGVRRVGADRSAEARINGIDERVDADVAIIDTGIDRTHPDLNVVGGYNCTTSDRADLHDGYGHGTHVAGTVGALDNGRGVVGVAPGARLWAVKVFDDAGDGWISWFVCGIDWVTAHRDPRDAGRPLIEAANMSLRSPLAPYTDAACGYPSGDIEHQAICRSIAAGTTYAVAAGNDSTYASFWRPAAYNEPITVSALADFDGKPGGVGSQADTCPWYAADEDDTFANFSNYGADVDVMAPGKCILSTYPGGRYAWMSGTSMATPTVAGAVALYKVRYPTARPQQIKQALVYAANLGWKTSTDPDGRPDRLLDVSSFAPPPVFSLAVGQPTRYLGASLSLSLPVRVGRANGHTAPVTLTLSGLPAGVTAATNPPAITGTTATLVLKGSSAMPNGRYPLTVRASDAELTASTSITLMTDAKAPVGRFTAPTPGSSRLQSSTVVAVAWSESESGGSGLVSRSLQRQRGAVVRPGSCMGFAYLNDGAASNRASPTSVSGLAGGFCYRWVERLTDGAGNTTSAVSGSVLVDTSAPGMPNVTAAGTNAAQVGTNGIVYFNGRLSGRMTLSASGSDPQSGMATTTFGRPSPATGWSGGGTTVTGEPASAALSWSVGATSTSVAVKSTNRVGLAGPARAMSLRSDVTGPTAATWRSPVGTSQQASTTRVLSWTSGTDSGSGVASRQLLQRQRGRIMTPGTCSGVSFGTDGSERIVSNGSSDSGLIGGYCYRWLLTAVDRVGNRGAAVASGAVLVDRVAPTSDFATPGEALTTFRASTTYRVAWTARDTGGSVLAGRSLQRQRGPIVRSGSCAGVRWANDGPRTTAASPVSASGLLGGSCYRWTLRQTDAAGNYRTHYSGAVLVDTSAPPAATITARGSNAYQAAANRPIYFRSSIARSLSVTSLGSDPQSGAASASVGKVTASGWSNGSANVGNPSTRTLSWSAGASNATISGTSRNRAGLLGPWRSVSLVGDRTAPVVRFTTPSSPVYAATTSIALAWTVTDSGSGVGTTGSLQRQRVASTKASCPTTGWAYDGAATRTTSGSTVGGLVPGFCYRWTLTFPDRVGNAARVTSTTVRVDGTPPVTSIRGLWPLAGVRLTSVRSVPIGFSWAATDDTGVVAGYEVRMRAGSGAWALLRLASATSTGLTTSVDPTLGYRFAIRARDRAGNWSGWIEAPVHFSYTQSTYSSVTYAGTWTSSSLLGATDGRVHWTMTAGARAKLTFRGRSVAWISTLGPDRGQADVYLDGVRIRTVDLRAASMVTRQSVFGAGWRTNGTHTVEIRSRGTSGRPRIDLDAFLVVGP